MIKQKSFKHNGFQYLMVAVKYVSNVVIRVSRDGEFLFDNDMSYEAYADALAAGQYLVEDAFDIIEDRIRNKH